MSTDTIQILSALPPEARPLIRAWGLKRQQPDGAFPQYVNGPLRLTLTGPGTEAAGRAVQFARGLNPGDGDYWINVGIAGHANLNPGSCLLAEEVVDGTSGTAWKLYPVGGLPEVTLAPIHCVAEAETDYEAQVGYDMESAAIARTLAESGELPRLQILKIVSDNPRHPSHQINAKLVGELITNRLPTLESLINRLQNHASSQ